MKEPSFSVGVEEEYLLVDKTSRKLASSPPEELFSACESALEGRVSPEFLRCQIEVGTPVCMTLGEVRAELAYFRKTVAKESSDHNLAPIAASTHPFAEWTDQPHTDKERYNQIARTMQVVARRMLICGMHVHVGIEDEELRIDLFNQLAYFLPHLLALSTSSPFWRGRNTGLKSYRLAVFNEMPRTGLPPRFESHHEYRHIVDILSNAGALEDATKIWWDLRPSDRFPTLELRITDVCPKLDDAVAIAALYRCLCRMLYRLRRANQSWRPYSRFLLAENRWQAQRHGTSAGLIDFGRNETAPFVDLAEELIELVRPDAIHFGCESELEHIRTIAAEGTSADKQLKLAGVIADDGLLPKDAFNRIVDHLMSETLSGL
ncbi:MAG: carboxylate-amine ligase [Roseibium album]|uniref:Putative glutamate--cysteine ligase 2 n=1 Tax=Roseibium album TaxID=311410 RepID=A0A0M7B036_9HYPH|nr:carboxylate-amine ligase [Roseibium album]MBG6143835.1 carboxylate-amine ligase [Labrenzia sp. EL_142]MBG6163899.1 carboxylate-amine ligase [Labrenzia sp. EL_195]MBG6178661.1 carboxylate-amine ligase [Labrenzia sp. EL_132]MBG6200431.1 carboxylate-amine ligase [Labrenzia sp. EL_13]MBG6233303.1 carboxylate-amine ligase [Labrenzia sp. EL_208]MCR9055847.1 carboxylate-amine ligase [Paracoccaceae bacterium]